MHLTMRDKKFLGKSLEIMKHLYHVLQDLPIEKARKDAKDMPEYADFVHRKDKRDTFGFDAIAEETISVGNNYESHISLPQKYYGIPGVVITEERGKICDKLMRIEDNTPVIISDPLDRSSLMKSLINKYDGSCKTLGDIFEKEAAALGKEKARLESVNSSVTLLKDDEIKYSIVLNLFTGEAYVAFEPGIFSVNIDNVRTIDDLTKPVEFKSANSLNALFYNEGTEYKRNSNGTFLKYFELQDIKSPGGPNRFLYLLKEPEGKETNQVGLIAHNGEKIQESLPNIAVAFFSEGALQAYKLFCDPHFEGHRADKLLTPNMENSLYKRGKMAFEGIRLGFLNNHEYPSDFRETTVIVPSSNAAAVSTMKGIVQNGFAVQII